MSDLISRSALKKYIRDYKWEFALNSDFSKAMEMVDVQPTIEAVPVVYGTWVEDLVPCGYVQKRSRTVKKCSKCEWTNACRYNFCPNCGADMR